MKTPTLLLLTLLPLTACKKPGILQPYKQADTNPLNLPPADIARQSKLQPIILCINRTFAHYEQIQPAYTKTIARMENPAPPPTPGIIPDISDSFQFKIAPFERNGEFAAECATALDRAIALPPADPAIDTPARDAAQALRAIQQPGAEMDAYFEQKAYLNDSFAHGRALDATLTPLLSRLADDSSQLRRVVRQQESTLRQHELDAIDHAEGHSLRWHTRKCLIEARNLNDALVTLARQRQLDAPSVAAATKPLQDAYADTQSFLAQHPEATRPDRLNNQPIWFSIQNDISLELGAANQLRAILTDPSLLPELRRDRINAQLEQVTTMFNGLVQTYNMLQQNHLGT